MIMITCTVISLMYVKQIKNHTKSVMQCVLLIENIKVLIEYKNMSVLEIFNVVSCSNNYSLLTFLNKINDGLDEYYKTINDVFSDGNIVNIFDYEDIENIKGFFSMLGVSDANGQITNCNFYKNFFEKKHIQLETEEKSKCKCVATLTFGVGLLLSIIII